MPKQAPLRTLKTHVVHENRWYQVQDNDVRFSGGDKGKYIRVITKKPYRDAVVVLPVMEDRSIVLMRQYQYAITQWSNNAPKGFGQVDRKPEQTAPKELQEEMGLVAERLLRRGSPLFADTGFFTTRLNMFFALGCKPTGSNNPDSTEAISKHRIVIPYDRINELLKTHTVPRGIEVLDEQGQPLTRTKDRRVNDLMTISNIQDYKLYQDALDARKAAKRPKSAMSSQRVVLSK